MLSGFRSFILRSRHCFIFKNLELLIYYMLAKSADPKLRATLLLPRSHLVILLTLCHQNSCGNSPIYIFLYFHLLSA